jgi:amphi-Trp domain-containing protein
MTEIEWETKLDRQQAADLLRGVAEGLAAGDTVKLEQDGLELKVEVADEVAFELEIELEDGETEVELELRWKAGGSRGADEDDAAGS